METGFRLKTISQALCIAFPMFALPAIAAEPYPALPPTLSTSVAPNVMLYIDTSASMLQDGNNAWMLTGLCDSDDDWVGCVNNNASYRNAIDSEQTSPNTKMNIAKRVARNLIRNNRGLRFGLFSFYNDKPGRTQEIGNNERNQAGILRRGIADISGTGTCESNTNCNNLLTAINAMNGRTATPLAEGLLDIIQYYKGASSLYGRGSYTSPIQYRCQKNFTILITDGEASNDQNLPGTGQKGEDGNSSIGEQSYTARDSNGAAVSKTFSVCRSSSSTADDGYNVTCPSTYDGETTTRAFGNDANRPSAVRDVAMLGFRGDLRVGGVEPITNGKDFDGVGDNGRFALQNMITYTVGFSTLNPVLPSAAKVGGGKYYSASNETELSTALNNAVASIADLVSNAGGVATKGDTISTAKQVFQPVFNPNGWFGELRCFDRSTATSATSLGAACSPNAKAVIPTDVPSLTNRRIYSSKVVGSTTTAFDFKTTELSTMTTYQQAALGSSANSNEERKNVINFLRGNAITGYRTRPNGLLGDIIDSQPLAISAPNGQTSDSDYSTFATNNANRGHVLIGANDGMMHAFRMSDMTEIMGYIPSPVYPRLKALKETDYGQSAGTLHNYYVNGWMRQSDIKVGGNWMTLAVGGLAQGGQGYYAIDATSEPVLQTNSAVKWEWTDVSDSEMGYSFPAPLIYNVRMSATTVVPAVIVSNGYENKQDDTAVGGQKTTANSSALYILNAATGALLKKITLPNTSGGLSSPAGLDIGQDGVLDYVYAGDINGNLWRFDLTGDGPSTFSVRSAPIFVAMDSLGNRQPIVIRPAIKALGKTSNLILFGTGKLQVDADRSDTKVQSFYAVEDKMDTQDNSSTVERSQMGQRTIDGAPYVETRTNDGGSPAVAVAAGTYRKISTTPAIDMASTNNTYRGWYLDFPDETERLMTSPILLDNEILFGTGIPKAAEACVPGGKGWVMGLNVVTGGVTKTTAGQEYSFVDVVLNNASDANDKLNFANGKAFISGYATEGIPTELTYINSGTRITTPDGTDGGLGSVGAVIALQDANMSAVFTGNGTASTGKPMGRPTGGGKGELINCIEGQPGCTTKKRVIPGGVKMETTIWREIK